MEKRGVGQLVAVVFLVVLVVVIGIIIFTFASRTATLETTKSADKGIAQEICRDKVKIRVNDVRSEGPAGGRELKVNVENLKAQDITDFVVRLEQGGKVDISKIRHVLGGYEIAVLTIDAGSVPEVVKVIPQITLKKPDLTSMAEGWWLCSDQMAVYSLR